VKLGLCVVNIFGVFGKWIGSMIPEIVGLNTRASNEWTCSMSPDLNFRGYATFSNISAISLRPVLVVEEARVPGENYRTWANNW
jgi:hypothetical protein